LLLKTRKGKEIMITTDEERTQSFTIERQADRRGRTNWYALWVKSRHEFVVSQELGRKGVDCFLPSVTRIRQWKDRKKDVICVLFPGYVFVNIPSQPEEFINIVKTRGAVRFVAIEPGHPTPVPSEEIDELKILVKSGLNIDMYPELQEGMAVRMKKGPLCDAVGVMTKRQNEHYFIVNVEILGRSVGMKIHADDIERA